MCDLEAGESVGEGGLDKSTELPEEEGIKPRYKVASDKPTQREIEEHMITHIPFRDWCPHCVRGKSKSSAHKRQVQEEVNEVPVVSIDYMYMESEESVEALGMPILVSRDRRSKWIGASVVTRKGNCPYAIKRLSEDLGALGYS